MVREINKDVMFLKKKARPAAAGDEKTAADLLDTLIAHKGECVGMAANMIGENVAIIAVDMGFANCIMLNPRIVKKTGPFDTSEGCLSLTGVRPCRRFKEIDVEYQDIGFNKLKGHFSGWTARIIQHECDHLDGIII